MASIPKIPKQTNALSAMFMLFALISLCASTFIFSEESKTPGRFEGYELWIFPAVFVLHAVLAIWMHFSVEKARQKILTKNK